MSISINYEHIRLLKRSARSLVWRFINQLRYHFPGPREAVSSDSYKGDIEVLWRGSTPEKQVLENKDWPYSHSLEEISFTAPYVLRLKKGRVFGTRGDIITKDGIVLTDVAPEIPRRKNQHFLISRGKMPTPTKIEGSVMVLSCGPHHNYFHFTFDAISRLRFFREISFSADYYCIPQDKSFQKDLAAIFGIDKRKIIPLEKDTHIVAKELIVSSLPGNHTNNKLVNLKDLDTCLFLRNHILPRISKNKSKYAPLIYIQRKGKRTVENEPELLEVLRKFGDWKVVRLEEHSVLEQAAIFHYAKVIVALHGAGLTNITYCQPNVKIVEILNPNLFEPLYFFIANLLGLHYSSLMANEVNRLIKKERDVRGAVKVDPEKLKNCLASISTSKVATH